MDKIFYVDCYTFFDFMFFIGIIGGFVFITLYYINAGYGKFYTHNWGPVINNKWGWLIMEMPVFFLFFFLWMISPHEVVRNSPYVWFLIIFEFHYFQRSFIFPLYIKGNTKMPLIIVILSVMWNVLNAYIQGFWLFDLAPRCVPDLYTENWIRTPNFIIGLAIFIIGWIINMHSDYVIRHLRVCGDTKHYLPKKGLFKYVTSANYLGEIIEWLGFAILTWSLAGLLFFWFTCCNLIPRSNSIYKKYAEEFKDEFDKEKLKRIIPFIY